MVKGEFDADESAESKAAARAASKISKVCLLLIATTMLMGV